VRPSRGIERESAVADHPAQVARDLAGIAQIEQPRARGRGRGPPAAHRWIGGMAPQACCGSRRASTPAQGDQTRWMRFTLDTVGKTEWPTGRLGGPIYPEGFEELATKRDQPLHPPGRDVRCIGMLTEGWDCSTVTHIIGLRPFMSQLLCEQVVGRGLRRASYDDFDEQGRLREEVAKVFGVPFEVIPFKANKQIAPPPPVKRFHVHALPNRANLEIKFPRVEGYTQAIRNRVTANWQEIPTLPLEPGRIPPEVEVKGLNVNNRGRPSLSGPGKLDRVNLEEFRSKRRLQELTFDLARTLTREYKAQPHCSISSHVLFPQLVDILERYLKEKVRVQSPAHVKDLFLAPYYGWVVERLVENIRGDVSQGETPEVPRYESTRGPGSTSEVDFWTSRDVREVNRSHLNYAVADTKRWEQSAAFFIDTHRTVKSFVKNSGLGFAIPYLHNGQMHDYMPDFIIQLNTDAQRYLILETKGYDPLKDVKKAAAERWVSAVNSDGKFGNWAFEMAEHPTEVSEILSTASS